MTDIRKIMGLAIAAGAFAGRAFAKLLRWEVANDPKPPRKATKDRSQIKKARKQKRNRK